MGLEGHLVLVKIFPQKRKNISSLPNLTNYLAEDTNNIAVNSVQILGLSE